MYTLRTKESGPVKSTGLSKAHKKTKRTHHTIFINESGLYSLSLSSKLESAKKFEHWVTSKVLPTINKYGQYRLFDNPDSKIFKIETRDKCTL